MNLKKLFEPTNIGEMEVKNRIVMPAMTTVFANESGAVTERLVNYFVERAKGGVGLIVTDAACIDYPQGKIGHATQLRVDHDKFIPGLNDLVKMVHRYGAKIALQLHHAGRQTTLEFTEGKQPVSASNVYDPAFNTQPRALEIEEIEVIIEKFGQGARRAKSAGFDAVEIHGAHGYLIQQFLSPYTNRRTDKYGGSLDRRMTFALEILRRVRDYVGKGFPIIFRLSAEEHVQGGLTLEDTKVIAQKLEEEGADALHVSSGMDETPPEYCDVPPMAVPRGCFVHYAAVIKELVDIPIITVGRINDPVLAERILQEGKADLVAMGRALIADPELPRKAHEGRLNNIRKCIACNMCTMRIGNGLRLACAINAAVGEENESKLTRVAKPKRILIVGGGPAGMEAARVSALRGHEVVLYDENERLGGQLRLAIKPPHKEELSNLLDYLSDQLRELDIEVKIGERVTAQLVQKINPDAVILATGAKPLIPNINGINNKTVVTAWDVLDSKVELDEEIVIAGGGTVGCETAEFLAEKGKKITIVEMLNDVALDAEPVTRKLLLKRLKEKNVKILTNSIIFEIKEGEILIMDTKSNRRENIKAENVVLSLGTRANDKLFKELKGKLKELYAIGDCVKPRKIIDAIYEGFHTALEI
jgi:2,4-dienoyl-CoA reductase-like NADH-dependent reductase (Old Yellow Enzyme family)/thioredoxin reductase